MNRSFYLAIALMVGYITTSASPAAAQSINNGGFETGDFSGWTLSGTINYTAVDAAGTLGKYTPQSGSYFAGLGPTSTGNLSQTFTDTNLGQNLTISFYLASQDVNGNGVIPNDFQISFNGTLLQDLQNISTQGYNLYSYNVASSSSSSSNTLTFSYYNSPSYFALDSVSVTPSGSAGNAVASPAPSTGIMALILLGIGLGVTRYRRVGIA